jgi:anti-sigma regulatory factor (Ser/Thr protein kinase)
MAELPNVRLSLVNTAENVVVIRAVLSGLAECSGVGADDLSDIRTAVTEACNNVVLHAYGGERGPLDVAIELGDDTMRVLVRDRGIGIGEHAGEQKSEGDMGIGLHVIRTLARTVELDEPPGGGTRVSMELAARGLRAAHSGLAGGPDLDLAGMMPDFAAAVSIAPASLARAVVPRLACALAAYAHFSTDRLADLQLLADALAAHAAGAVCEQHISLGVTVQPRDLELRVAPLRLGAAEGLVRASDLDGLGRAIEKLADRHSIFTAESHETLALGMLDRR